MTSIDKESRDGQMLGFFHNFLFPSNAQCWLLTMLYVGIIAVISNFALQV